MEEHQYLGLIKEVLNSDNVREGRNGAKTRAIFGHVSKYSLANDTLPVLTSKRVFLRGVIEELLWILKGETNANILKEKGIHIWDGHTSKEHHKTIGKEIEYEEGDAGPLYGHQWRHSGATYTNMNGNYKGKGIDQIKSVIESIKKDPYGRRHVVSAWNPVQIEEMVLPPCHCLFQFSVHPKKGLSCCLYQRSADVALGVPFNITSYSILTHLIAKVCGLKTDQFIHVIGDAHIYEPHEGPIKTQLNQPLYPFPKIQISEKWDLDIDTLKYDDIRVVNYKCNPSIKMPLVI